jgi:hypothetical protein
MSDRLQELLRQKVLLEEHAAWLEREIVREKEKTGATAASAVTPPPPESPPAQPVSVDADADAILEQYRSASPSIRPEVTRGCLLYFFGALLLVALSLLAIYLTYYRR